MKNAKMLAILVLALGLMVCQAKVSEAALMGTAFTYQGRLIDANSAAEGLYDFQFKLFDDPNVVLGTQLGSDVNEPDVDVIDGYFTVELDFGGGVFDGNAVWLEIGVRPGELKDPCEYTPLVPRQEVTPTPYAIYALSSPWRGLSGIPSGFADGVDDDGGLTLPFSGNVNESGSAFMISNSSTANFAFTLHGLMSSASSGSNSAAVRGENHGTTNFGSGVMGSHAGIGAGVYGSSISGRGVWGLATSSTGTTYGVYGQSNSNDGLGVFGFASAGTGFTYGVYGRSDSNDGKGVYGVANASTGINHGGYFQSNSTSGRGVYGVALANSGNTQGVYGTSSSTSGRGVSGVAFAASGTTYGGRFQSNSPDGRGVYGFATSGSGTTYGVYGKTTSPDGYAGYFEGNVSVTGNVGIGTTSPSAKLDVRDAANDAYVNVSGQDDGKSVYNLRGGSAYIWYDEAEPELRIYNAVTGGNAGSIVLGTSNIERMRITRDGNVGIGISNPGGAKFAVNGVSVLGGTDSSPDASLEIVKSGGTDLLYLSSAADNDGDMFTVKNTGNVGIGTATPLSKLSVGGDGYANTGVYGEGSFFGVGGKDSGTGSYGRLGQGDFGVYGYGTNGVYGSGTFGVYGNGNDTGVYGHCKDDSETNYGVSAVAGSTSSNDAYGVHSIVERDGTGDYWSGYFYGSGSGGAYGGLYADVRSGGLIDLAEYILDTKGDTEAGDVLAADPDNDESVIKSSIPYDSTVVGIVSTQPHLLMGMELVMDEETGERYEDVDAAMLALAGRVPVKVTDENGPIERGDLLTTSSKPGYAMKWTLLDVNQAEDFDKLKSMLAENERRRNTVVGKALGNLDSGDGKIVALVNLQ
jgi:hypothetical protein